MGSRHTSDNGRRLRAAARAIATALAAGALVCVLGAPAVAQYFSAKPKTPETVPVPPPAGSAKNGAATKLEGDYDVNELRRMIDVARESGFTEAQIREITVEDENGNIVNAWAFLQEYERRQRENEARLAAQRNKVYLAPKDIIRELDEKQQQDLDALREKLLFVE